MNRTNSISSAANRETQGDQPFAVWVGLSRTLSAFTTSNLPVRFSVADADLKAELDAWEAASDEDLAKFEKELA